MKYNPEIVDKIIELRESGEYTDKDICKIVGISHETFITWKKNKPEFSERIKKAENERLESYKNMARSGLAKLLDVYEYEEVSTEYANKNGKPAIKSKKVTKKRFMPNVTAIIFTLTNTDPKNFKHKKEPSEIGDEKRITEIKKTVVYKRDDA